MKKKYQTFVSVCLAFIVVLTCAAGTVVATPAINLIDLKIEDLEKFTQMPSDYLASSSSESLISDSNQNELAKSAILTFFNPWSRLKAAEQPLMDSWGMTFFKNPRWGANLQRINDDQIKGLYDEADMGNFPSMNNPAIIICDSDSRNLPTEEPVFANPDAAGEGFPFDYMQKSRLRSGTPVLVRHESKNGEWLLVESPHFPGWVRRHNVAFASSSFISEYDTGNYAAITKDGVTLRDENGNFICTANVGSLFPIAEIRKDGTFVLNVPTRSSTGEAELALAILSNGAEQYPIKYNATNIATLADSLMYTKYGWAGLYGYRDCSQFLMELYMPFGISFPRKSNMQQDVFPKIDISHLSAEEKIETVRKYSTPFCTLLGFKGHVGIYVGTVDEEPLMLHCAWGVRLNDGNGLTGRLIMGKAVVTTLRPGKEVANVEVNALLDKLTTIEFLPGASQANLQ